jgi:hypothetical protein
MKQSVSVRHNGLDAEQAPHRIDGGFLHPMQRKIDGSPRQLAQQDRLTQLQNASMPARADGLPPPLRTGIVALSGMDMSSVAVHRNSARPAQMNALAYAQGDEIHLGPGQEKHLPHEAWHVVQQRQGRVRATTQLAGFAVNDNAGLEREADAMGARALQMQRGGASQPEKMAQSASTINATPTDVKQCVIYGSEAAMWAAVEPGTSLEEIRAVINANAELRAAYEDSLLNLNRMNFVERNGQSPEAAFALNATGNYDINYGRRATLGGDFAQAVHFIWGIIHEMGHVNSGLQYATNIAPGELYHVSNMHLPAAVGPTFAGTTIGRNQSDDPVHGWQAQRQTMLANWAILVPLRSGDTGFGTADMNHLKAREDYGQGVGPETHYDTVLTDILYYLQFTGLTETHYYAQATAMLHEANTRRRAGAGDVAAVALVAAPANRFLALYNAVAALLNDVAWAQEGEALIGHKVPSGIASMRTKLTIANKRDALNEIKGIALAQGAVEKKKRSKSTKAAYDVLSELDRRNHFDEVIAQVTLCRRFLGQAEQEIEL